MIFSHRCILALSVAVAGIHLRKVKPNAEASAKHNAEPSAEPNAGPIAGPIAEPSFLWTFV